MDRLISRLRSGVCGRMFGREILRERSATGNFRAGSYERFSARRRSHILRWIEDAGERKREKRIAKTVEVAVQKESGQYRRLARSLTPEDANAADGA
jgi:hypothetical protein